MCVSNWSLGGAASAPVQAPQSENRGLGRKLIESRGDIGRSSSLETWAMSFHDVLP